MSLDRFLVKVAWKEKDFIDPIAVIPLMIVKVILHNNPPLSCLPHTSHEVFKGKCRLIYFSLYFVFYLFIILYYITVL